MLHKKKEYLLGKWAIRGEDIKKGDIIKILSNGFEEESKYGPQTVFKIETRNGEKKVGLNQTSINTFIKEYGEDDSNWIGKEAHIIVVQVPDKDPYYYFAPQGYIIGKNGLEKENKGEITKEEIESIDEDKVKIEDVPF